LLFDALHTQLLSPRVFAQQPGSPFVLAMSSASHAQDVAAGVMLDRYEALFADLTMPRLSNENIISYVLRRAANEDLAENGMISLLFRRLSVCSLSNSQTAQRRASQCCWSM
jgi:hypothetical protein